MTPREERDLSVVTLAKQVGIIASAVLAVIALSGLTYRATFGSSQAAQDRRMDDQDRRIETVIRVVELQAVIAVEPPGSAEAVQALTDLREMRRVVR